MCNLVEKFKDYLVETGKYPRNQLAQFPVKSRWENCDGVRVYDKPKNGRIIQAFALMPEELRTKHHVYPFYRTTKWGGNNGPVYPSCSIATMDKDGKWTIYDAGETGRARDEDSYINYEKAKQRFEKRYTATPAMELRNKTRCISLTSAAILIAYFVARLLFPSLNLPLNAEVVSLFIFIVVLVMLPVLIPFITSIKVFGIDVLFGKE